jgi:membrane associated rhomboid family serine protease
MWFLWIFGDNVEDALGSFRFVFFYLVCGLAAGFTHFILGPSSAIPTIGASGAIAGVLGGYLVLYPGARVLTLVPLGFFLRVMDLPAALMIGLWFIVQLASGLLTQGMENGGVAWWAHVGGFVAGLVLVRLLRRRRLVV